jgi:trk system potassium uptake protein TrkA
VIERAGARETVATRSQRSLVLHGEATDENVLAQENIDEMDMFLALTNDDEDNIMAASLAKRLGCKRVLALINRRAYADMVQGGPIDIGLSPAQVSIGSLLTFVAAATWRGCTACAAAPPRRWNWWCTATARASKVVGRRIEELPVIKGAHIGAIVRDRATWPWCRTAFLIDGFGRPGDHSAPRHGDRGGTTTSSSSAPASAWCRRSKSCSRSASSFSERTALP